MELTKALQHSQNNYSKSTTGKKENYSKFCTISSIKFYTNRKKWMSAIILKWFRRVVSFLYEGNAPGKGRTSCQFTLETVFETLIKNKVSTEDELKPHRIDKNTNFNETLKFIEKNSRGKCFQNTFNHIWKDNPFCYFDILSIYLSIMIAINLDISSWKRVYLLIYTFVINHLPTKNDRKLYKMKVSWNKNIYIQTLHFKYVT